MKKNQKRESRRERELMSTILDNIPAMVTFFDVSGKIRYVNRSFEQRTGWSKDLLQDKDLVALCFPDAKIREEALAFMLSGQPGWRTFPIRAADENIIHSSWSNVRLSDGSYVGIGIDMTKELLMEKRIRSLAIQLSKAVELAQQKIAGAIHDRIVQSLVSIKHSIEGLHREDSIPGTTVSGLEDVLEVLDDTIQETRTISHELCPPVLTHLQIDDVLRWLAECLQEQYGFPITIETEGHIKPLDSEKKYFIYMAVRELIHNTFKHAGAKRVKLALCAGKKRITITVQDDGKGFDQSTLDDLSYGEGGFGLFHIKMRLDQYGGVLSVKSKIGGGTSITISIPVTHEPERIDLL
jgi:PAS domain S-box-containing protein